MLSWWPLRHSTLCVTHLPANCRSVRYHSLTKALLGTMWQSLLRNRCKSMTSTLVSCLYVLKAARAWSSARSDRGEGLKVHINHQTLLTGKQG